MSAQGSADPEGAPAPLGGLLGQIGWYLPGYAVRLVAATALVPLYAVYLEPAQLGRLMLVQVAWILLRTIATLGLPSGLFRLLAEYRGDTARRSEGDDVLVTAFWSQAAILGGAFGLAALAAAGLESAGWLEGWGTLILLGGLLPLLVMPREVVESELRARGSVRAWTGLSSAQQIATTGAAAFVLVRGGATAEGVLVAQAIAFAACSIVAPALVWRAFTSGRWSTALLRRMVRFGAPTVPALISDWVSQFADRFLLGAMSTLDQVGLYALGWRVGQVTESLVTQATYSAWQPFLFQRYDKPDGAQAIARAATYVALGGMAFVVPLGASARPLFEVLRAEAYLPVAPIVFFVAFAYWMALLRHLLLAPTATHFKPERALPVWLLGAVANIALNLALIPAYGFKGAVAATVISYALTIPLAIRVSRALWVIPFEWRRLATIAGAGVVVGVAASQIDSGLPPTIALLVEPAAGLASYVVLLVILRFPIAEEWRTLRGMLR